MKVAIFIGTRPEAIKLAPVVRVLSETAGMEAVVISTGQHREMLQQVFELFNLPVHISLSVMEPSQTLSSLTSRLVTEIDRALDQVRPDFALVQGDTSTVLAASLCCFYRGVTFGHVEAGLRTGNIHSPFPEEANRVLASRLATLHFAPTTRAQENLLAEGVPPASVLVTGNTVIDALELELARQRHPDMVEVISDRIRKLLGVEVFDAPYVLITGHRRENFGQGFREICKAIADLAEKFLDVLFVYPVHLNPNVQGPVRELLDGFKNVRLVPPLNYSDFVALMSRCKLVLTDSGGVQEEAPSLGKPVIVMRDSTERPEGVEAGTVRLVGPHHLRIVEEVSELLRDESAYAAMAQAKNPYGDGKASVRIVHALETFNHP